MRKAFSVLVAGIILSGALASSATAEVPQPVHIDREMSRQCRFQWVDKPLWTAREERLTAKCAVDHWSVYGGLSKFIAVGSCESGWYRFANNGGNYLGLFQHSASAWYYRTRSYIPIKWRWGQWDRWTNSRAQIIVTARMVHMGGWGPWTCA